MTARDVRSPKARSIAILATGALLMAANVLVAALPARRDVVAASAFEGAEVAPKVLRFGGPGAYKQDQRMWGLLEIARTKGFLDREFAGSGTRIEYIGFTTVPMVGEALASGAIDFAGQGELIAILSRSAGTDTRMILPVSREENAYLAVPRNSSIRRIEDIRGKRIAFVRGGYIHIQTLRILADHGMSERDIVPVNLDGASSATVLASNGIDGVFLGVQAALPLRDRGIARIAYDTRSAPRETAQTGLIVRADFAREHPRTTARVVKALVRAARWAEDPRNRDELARLWVYGTSNSDANIREDLGPGRLTGRTSPLIDTFVMAQYRNTQAVALQAGLLTKPIDLDRWIDRSFLDRALAEERLTRFWPYHDALGREVPYPAVQTAGSLR